MKWPALLLLCLISTCACAQGEKELLVLNASIEEAVVKKQIKFLEEAYAEDFVFTHGTGFVEGKKSWIKNVNDATVQFTLRQPDSTSVELHDDVGLVIGKLTIVRTNSGKETKYGIWYIRVYRKKDKRWQMISHRTTKQWEGK